MPRDSPTDDLQEMLPDWVGDPATKVDEFGIHVLTLTGRCSCGNCRYIVAPDWKIPAADGGGYYTDDCHECLDTMEFEEAWERVDGLVTSYDELRPKQLVTDGGVDRLGDEGEQDRYHVCVTCGRLKHEDLFEIGDCTCKDCYNADDSKIRYDEAPDGNGFVAVSHEANDE